MKWFANIRTKNKLFTGFGVIIVILLALAGVENYQSARAISEYETLMKVHMPLQAAGGDVENTLFRERLVFEQIRSYSSPDLAGGSFIELREQYLQLQRKVQAELLRLQTYLQTVEEQSDDPDIMTAAGSVRKQFVKITRIHEDFVELAAQAITAIERGDRGAFIALKGRLDENETTFWSMTDVFAFEVSNLLEAAQGRIESIETTTTIARVLAFSIGILFVSFFATYISRLIARPLIEATMIAERLGQGDTTIPIQTDREDEIGDLLKTLEKLRANSDHEAQVAARIADGDLTVHITPLSEKDVLGKALSTMVDRLRSQIGEMLEGINVLAAATAELSSTMVQIAASARATASAVNETASTLQEVKQSSQMSNQKARIISDDTQETLRVSRDGVEAIGQSINSMESIREQMRGIAESIIKLSEQGQAISDIVTSVNDLAEQSNILAVNAAIEAAKAGDYGKGFTVVAREIRNHAEQSKQATAKVRSILVDTQKATASAVMVAERGTKLAEDGAQLSAVSGKAIQTVMNGITDAAESLLQIAASSKEQVLGLDQVTTAIQHIKNGSEQNVESIHQVELTAQNLKELGTRLQRFVERYKL
ncbi:MAG: methyl-accepting chemotaxis protein [Bacteroidia bacterium]|nr:methyl-accepting chemotaxis protein [Bacteroidia bacterium]